MMCACVCRCKLCVIWLSLSLFLSLCLPPSTEVPPRKCLPDFGCRTADGEEKDGQICETWAHLSFHLWVVSVLPMLWPSDSDIPAFLIFVRTSLA